MHEQGDLAYPSIPVLQYQGGAAILPSKPFDSIAMLAPQLDLMLGRRLIPALLREKRLRGR
eukprot:8554090-Pyramimonas_sp.AAC.1